MTERKRSVAMGTPLLPPCTEDCKFVIQKVKGRECLKCKLCGKFYGYLTDDKQLEQYSNHIRFRGCYRIGDKIGETK